MNKFQLFKDFCNDYLFDLTGRFKIIFKDRYLTHVDDNNLVKYRVTFNIEIITDIKYIDLDNINTSNSNSFFFKYSDIKDNMDTFMIMLAESYNIIDISIHNGRKNTFTYDIINGQLDSIENIRRIEIKVLEKN